MENKKAYVKVKINVIMLSQVCVLQSSPLSNGDNDGEWLWEGLI